MGRLLPAILAMCAMHAAAQGEPPADLIVHNAIVHTLAVRQPRAEAIAIRGDRFVKVGSSREVLALRGPASRVIDAGGAAIVPGLQDAHGHVVGLGESLRSLDLAGTASLESVVERVRGRAQSARPGEWILGRGWDQNDWPVKDWPTAAAFDAAAPSNPVWLVRVDGHAGLANTRALAAAGIARDTPDPPGGRIIRDARGRPAGVLVDAAKDLVERHVPQPGPGEIREQVLLADKALTRVGVTMVHDAGASLATIDVYASLVREGRIGIRLYVMLTGADVGGWFARGPLIDPQHRLTVRAVKLVADGALGSRGAALLEGYADEPGTRGLLVTDPDTLYARTASAAAAGFQPAVHAIGDRANHLVLDVFERVMREQPQARALRPRDEHAQVLDGPDIPRLGALGVIASVQATHCTSDMPWVPARLGDARTAEGAYAWRKILDGGAVLANGSDFPVERPDPLFGFYAAITRQDREGHPAGGWAPGERLTRAEALHSFTLGAAYAAHAEGALGSIEPGKLADLVILSRDIMSVEPRDVLTTTVLRTIVGGRIVYDSESP